MVLLGAQLDDLDQLAATLRSTEGEIGSVHAESASASARVVADVRTATLAARSAIDQLMERLRASVTASAARADGAVWSGHNRDRFIDGYHEFDAAMVRAEGSTTSAFADFGTAIEQMATGLETYAGTLASSLDQAMQATAAMATAVDQQRAGLDQVMNQGLNLR